MADENLYRINELFKKISAAGKPTKPLMKKIAGSLLASIENNFETEGKDVPGGWPALKPSTLKQKEKNASYANKILQREGFLVGSMQTNATEDTAEAGTNKIYAGAMNFGMKVYVDKQSNAKNNSTGNLAKEAMKKSNTRELPARQFLYLTDFYMNEIIELLENNFKM